MVAVQVAKIISTGVISAKNRKGGSCEKFLRKKKKSSGILRNPGRNVFLGPRNKFLSYRKMQPRLCVTT
jgi:hypothetical protein